MSCARTGSGVLPKYLTVKWARRFPRKRKKFLRTHASPLELGGFHRHAARRALHGGGFAAAVAPDEEPVSYTHLTLPTTPYV